jgi:hypothetical protein
METEESKIRKVTDTPTEPVPVVKEKKPRQKRGPAPKSKTKAPKKESIAAMTDSVAVTEPKKRGRPKKAADPTSTVTAEPKKRGRPRKNPTAVATEPKKRGRPRKNPEAPPKAKAKPVKASAAKEALTLTSFLYSAPFADPVVVKDFKVTLKATGSLVSLSVVAEGEYGTGSIIVSCAGGPYGGVSFRQDNLQGERKGPGGKVVSIYAATFTLPSCNQVTVSAFSSLRADGTSAAAKITSLLANVVV